MQGDSTPPPRKRRKASRPRPTVAEVLRAAVERAAVEEPNPAWRAFCIALLERGDWTIHGPPRSLQPPPPAPPPPPPLAAQEAPPPAPPAAEPLTMPRPTRNARR